MQVLSAARRLTAGGGSLHALVLGPGAAKCAAELAPFGVDRLQHLDDPSLEFYAPEAYAAFEADQTACIVGKVTADKYQLKIGERLPLESTIYPCAGDLKMRDPVSRSEPCAAASSRLRQRRGNLHQESPG